MGSVFFLTLATRKYFAFQNKKFKIKNFLFLVTLVSAAPIFSLYGFALFPDSPLTLFISASLFVMVFVLVERRFCPKIGFILGVIFGLGFLSKFQIIPIIIGFVFVSYIVAGWSKFWNVTWFWIAAFAAFLLVSSPFLYWNFKNQWATFTFQSQHGFSQYHFSFKQGLVFLLGTIFYLLPWYFYFFAKQTYFSLKRFYGLNRKIEVLFLLPFLLLFVLIFISAFGTRALPHWTMPGFFVFLPLVIFYEDHISFDKKIWNFVHIFSAISTLFIPVLLGTSFFQNFLVSVFTRLTGDASPLFELYFLQNLQQDLRTQHQIHIPSSSLETADFSTTALGCRPGQVHLASLRWFWSAEMALRFKNHPRVFNFDFSKSSSYSWRDGKTQFQNGCEFLIIASKSHFHKNVIQKFMKIRDIKTVNLKPYQKIKVVVIRGQINNVKRLKRFYKAATKNISY